MITKELPMLAFIFLSCNSDKSDSAIEVLEDTSPIPNPIADIDWNEDKLVLTIQNGEGHDFTLGIIESSDSCNVDITYGCWTAESCSEEPWTSVDGNYIEGPYCHSAGDAGVSLDYGGGILSVIAGDSFVTNTQTAFPAPTEESSYEFQVSYILIDRISQDCWAWGVDPFYFNDQNCKYPVPIMLDTPKHWRIELH